MPFLPARPRRSNVIRQAGRHGKSGAGFGVRFDKPTPGPSPRHVFVMELQKLELGAQQLLGALGSQVPSTGMHAGAKAGHDPPKEVEEGSGLWSWMLPPPGPEPSNVWSESDSVVYLISPPWVSRILNTSLTPGSPTSSTTTPNSTSPNMLLVAVPQIQRVVESDGPFGLHPGPPYAVMLVKCTFSGGV